MIAFCRIAPNDQGQIAQPDRGSRRTEGGPPSAFLPVQGFTTRKNGHGFGLHSGANDAKEMEGSLCAHSDGLGKGAAFTLELPVAKSPANDVPAAA